MPFNNLAEMLKPKEFWPVVWPLTANTNNTSLARIWFRRPLAQLMQDFNDQIQQKSLQYKMNFILGGNGLHSLLSENLLLSPERSQYTFTISEDNEHFFAQPRFTSIPPPRLYYKCAYKVSNSNEIKTITDEKIIKREGAALVGFVEAVLNCLSPKNNEGKDYLYKLLIARDNSGSTPLHCLYENRTLHKKAINQNTNPITDDLYSRILPCIKPMSDDQKKHILKSADKQGRALLTCLLLEPNILLQALFDIFGDDAVQEAIFWKNEKTGSNVLQEILKGGFPYKFEPVLRLAKEKGFLKEELLKQEDNARENVLHSIFRYIGKQTTYIESAIALLTTEEKSGEGGEPGEQQKEGQPASEKLINQLAMMKNNNGENPLHYACSFGEEKAVSVFLGKLSEKRRQEIVKAKTKQGWTALHYAYRYGSIEMVNHIISAFDLKDLYQIAKVECLGKLKGLLKQNPNYNANLHNWQENGRMKLMDAYDYLVKRNAEWNITPSRKKDVEDRIKDFKECLAYARDRRGLPNLSQDTNFESYTWGCLFSSSQRYWNVRMKLQNITPGEVSEFVEFLESRKDCCEVARNLTKLGLSSQLDGFGASTPSAPSLLGHNIF